MESFLPDLAMTQSMHGVSFNEGFLQGLCKVISVLFVILSLLDSLLTHSLSFFSKKKITVIKYKLNKINKYSNTKHCVQIMFVCFSDHHFNPFTYLRQAGVGIHYNVLPGKKKCKTNKLVMKGVYEYFLPGIAFYFQIGILFLPYLLRKLSLLKNTQFNTTHNYFTFF